MDLIGDRMLQDKIVNDMKDSRDSLSKAALKVIIGELQRQPTKQLSDEQVIVVLKKLLKYEDERLGLCSEILTSSYKETIKKYLPDTISEEQIVEWIQLNYDRDNFPKNTGLIVGAAKKNFGNTVDGKVVKQVLEKYF